MIWRPLMSVFCLTEVEDQFHMEKIRSKNAEPEHGQRAAL